MVVRDRAIGDLSALKDVYFWTRLHACPWLQRSTISLDDFEKDTEGERIWVAEAAAKIVGFIAVWEPENFIHHLYVLPKFAGRTFGSRLLAACLETIGRPARLKCVSANIRALAFYRARGWRTITVGSGLDGEYQLMQIDER